MTLCNYTHGCEAHMVALNYETTCLLRAQGHEVYGPEYADDILEKIRKQVLVTKILLLKTPDIDTSSVFQSYENWAYNLDLRALDKQISKTRHEVHNSASL